MRMLLTWRPASQLVHDLFDLQSLDMARSSACGVDTSPCGSCMYGRAPIDGHLQLCFVVTANYRVRPS